MARGKFTAPTLNLRITPDAWEKAKQSDSGGCLIVDTIKQQYPHLSSVTVDMATVRATDKKKGMRYLWLTPETARMLLLSFDQGWSQTTEEVKIQRAVKVWAITRGKLEAAEYAAKLERLEAKVAAGEELTPGEKTSLTRLRNSAKRPSSRGKVEVSSKGVVHGGDPPRAKVPPNPNLLHGRDRHFGAKLAQPGQIFQEAVDQAVAEKLAAQGKGS